VLKAGTDLDMDGVLGELGELFGAYPRDNAPSTLEFDRLSEYEVDFVIR